MVTIDTLDIYVPVFYNEKLSDQVYCKPQQIELKVCFNSGRSMATYFSAPEGYTRTKHCEQDRVRATLSDVS